MLYPSTGFKLNFQKSNLSRNIVLDQGTINDTEKGTSRVVGSLSVPKQIGKEYTIYYNQPAEKFQVNEMDYTIQERIYKYPNVCPLVRVSIDSNGNITSYAMYTVMPNTEDGFVNSSGKLGDVTVEEVEIVGNTITVSTNIAEIIEIYINNIGELSFTETSPEVKGKVITLDDSEFDGIIASVQYMKGL
jgi:hypothetical protein